MDKELLPRCLASSPPSCSSSFSRSAAGSSPPRPTRPVSAPPSRPRPPTGGTVVAPVVVPAYGYGWHPFGFGFGIFGFFATLFFVFVVFALIRAIVWRGGPGRRGGWGGHGYYGYGYPGPGDGTNADRGGRSPWESRAHDTFETWHRQAHDAPAAGQVDAPAPPTPPADPV